MSGATHSPSAPIRPRCSEKQQDGLTEQIIIRAARPELNLGVLGGCDGVGNRDHREPADSSNVLEDRQSPLPHSTALEEVLLAGLPPKEDHSQ
jgi:hypothetical protein